MLHRCRPYGARGIAERRFYTDVTPTGFKILGHRFSTQMLPIRGFRDWKLTVLYSAPLQRNQIYHLVRAYRLEQDRRGYKPRLPILREEKGKPARFQLEPLVRARSAGLQTSPTYFKGRKGKTEKPNISSG